MEPKVLCYVFDVKSLSHKIYFSVTQRLASALTFEPELLPGSNLLHFVARIRGGSHFIVIGT